MADRDDEVDLAEVNSPENNIQTPSQRAEEGTSIATETTVNTSVTDQKRKYSEKDNNEDVEFGPAENSKRFRVSSSEKTYNWSLPKDMNDYVNDLFSHYTPDKDIQESIMQYNPVPNNMVVCTDLDDFLKQIMEEKQKGKELALDKLLRKFQEKTLNIMGPMSRLWHTLENASNSEEQKVELSIDDFRVIIEQSITLTGQLFNSLTYQRRLNVLQSITTKDSKAKQLLRDKASLLESNGKHLFGSNFEEDIIKTLKSKKKCEELLKKHWSPQTNQKPFQKGPPQQNRGGGGRSFSFAKKESQGKNKLFSRSFPQHSRHTGDEWPKGSSSSISPVCHGDTSSTSGRTIKFIPKKLESVNTGSSYPVSSGRLRNSIFKRATPRETHLCINECRTGQSHTPGGPRNVKEGGNPQSSSSPKTVFKPLIFSGQKRWGQATSYKSKTIKLVHSLPTFQNGGPSFTKGTAAEQRLSMQTRSKRCLLLYTNESKVEEVPPFSVGRESVRVPLYVFRTRSGPSHFHKTDENTNIIAQEDKHQSNSVLGRHVADVSNHRINRDGPGHDYISITKSGVCSKSEKVSNDSSETNIIFRDNSRLRNNDFSTSTGKSRPDCRSVRRISETSRDNNFGPNKVNREAVICSSGSSASQVTTQVFAGAAKQGACEGIVLQHKDSVKQTVSTGDFLVEGKSDSAQWKTFTDSAYRVCDSDRCLNYRLGSTLSGCVNGRDMVSSGTQKTYKCAGNDRHKISPVHFHKDEESEVNSLSDRQYGGSKLSSEDGGSSQPGAVTTSKRDMGLSVHQPDHDYCRISPQSLECEGRLGSLAITRTQASGN